MAVILVIDDSSAARQYVRMALAGAGHAVIEAGDGQAGLALFHEQRPHLVITDLVMPVKDGIETIRELRKHDPEVAILAISGSSPAFAHLYLSAARKLGAHATLSKPFQATELCQAVERLLVSNLTPATPSIQMPRAIDAFLNSGFAPDQPDCPFTGRERRRFARREVVWSGRIHVSNGVHIQCAVLDVSEEGAKVILTHPLPTGEQILFLSPRFDPVRAEVVWTEGPSAGLRFLDGLDWVSRALGGKEGDISPRTGRFRR
jgi:CheY-like chemotaxis protein